MTGGSALVEVRDGREVWSDAAGDRGLDDARGARPGDRVRIGSVTKSMVAAVVLQLDGEGAIDIDEPIGAYLPGLLPYEEDPTVRQLLQHTSGVPDWVAVAYPGLEAGDLTLGGVQMGCPDDPEEVFLGHVGDGMGHQTQTFHSYDGERQITLSWSIDDKHGYADPAAFGEALSGLLSAGLCG
ncbi:serine hydrolase [Glycomyces luteolus]|uniref:Serine hydrolase n=1 Tax=Glycomyces luteolus TaxID=2670330 RepID=A0A9X3PC39_9ACTN|nr:serine hydrolase domain-containing protein [Glycomyces luteolus]MDA1361351.1 serine hydrolase [Glycomyces luteolus]